MKPPHSLNRCWSTMSVSIHQELKSATGAKSYETRQTMITIDHPDFRRFSKSGLTRFFNRARKAVGLHGNVDVLLADDATLRRLNKTFRGKNKATDVLSFPAAENPDDQPAIWPSRSTPPPVRPQLSDTACAMRFAFFCCTGCCISPGWTTRLTTARWPPARPNCGANCVFPPL